MFSGESTLIPFMLDSPPSSPKRNAAFSRPTPEVGRLEDLKKGDVDLGGDDLVPTAEEVSGSNIQENEDCAMLDRVGTGAFGRSDGPEESPSASVSIELTFLDSPGAIVFCERGFVGSSTSGEGLPLLGEGGTCCMSLGCVVTFLGSAIGLEIASNSGDLLCTRSEADEGCDPTAPFPGDEAGVTEGAESSGSGIAESSR